MRICKSVDALEVTSEYNPMAMLRKIDCVMVRVDHLESARRFYENTLGLAVMWSDEHSVALGMAESDAEIVLLHDDANIPRECNVHYLVDDVVETVAKIVGDGCRVIVAPFDVRIGKCAVVSDPSGNQLSLIDTTRGSGRI